MVQLGKYEGRKDKQKFKGLSKTHFISLDACNYSMYNKACRSDAATMGVTRVYSPVYGYVYWR